MTYDEAIKTLREDYCGNRIICELYPDQCNREDCEIWLAIKALENAKNDNSTPESAQNVPNQAFKMQKSDVLGVKTGETCSDTISRQAAIDAILTVTGNSSVRELYEHVQEHGLSDMWSGGVNAAIDIIIAVPSTQPDITPDGTLKVSIDADIASVSRILLSQTGTQYGGLYYKDAQPEPKWIPCKERLPDKDGLYLVTYFSGHARWTGTDEFLVDGTEESHWKYANIIAWQPLPKPFREGGDYA